MKKRLYATYFDCTNEIIFECFIHHLDSTRVQTIIYTRESLSESDVIRLPIKINRINIIAGIVSIVYNNGCTLEIVRK